jgi:hypothetical protein
MAVVFLISAMPARSIVSSVWRRSVSIFFLWISSRCSRRSTTRLMLFFGRPDASLMLFAVSGP